MSVILNGKSSNPFYPVPSQNEVRAEKEQSAILMMEILSQLIENCLNSDS
jgi:hypothetical protein